MAAWETRCLVVQRLRACWCCLFCFRRRQRMRLELLPQTSAEVQISLLKSFSAAELSFCSWGSGSPGTRYSPSTHLPRSTSWHRSEQKGRKGLSFHSTGLPQVGHFMNLAATHRHASSRQRRRSLDQYSSFDECDRTFAAHGIQADGDTFTSGAHN